MKNYDGRTRNLKFRNVTLNKMYNTDDGRRLVLNVILIQTTLNSNIVPCPHFLFQKLKLKFSIKDALNEPNDFFNGKNYLVLDATNQHARVELENDKTRI